MVYVFSAVRCLLLAFAMYGYLRVLCKHMRAEFTFAVLFSSIGSVMFLAGLLNILFEAMIAIAAVGLMLALRSVRRGESPRPLLTPGTVFFAVLCVYVFFVLYGVTLNDYDDFSHWGTIIKLMLRENRLPTFQDDLIQFQSYPPGTACFIYFFARASGIPAEWLYLYMQNVLTFAMLLPLFAFAQGPLGLCCAALAVLILPGGISSALYVDVPLTVTALAAAALFLHAFRAEPACKSYPQLLPVTTFLLLIKNSGALFVVMILCLLIFVGRLYRAPKQLLLQAAAPFAALLLWQRHVRLVFANGMSALHSMSFEYLSSTFASKSASDIAEISGAYFQETFSPGNRVLFLIGAVLLLAFLQRLCGGKDPLALPAAVLGSVFYMVYMIGMWAMYLFSMPANQAVELGGYGRYHSSILLFLSGLLALFILPHIQMQSGRRFFSCIAGTILILMLARINSFSFNGYLPARQGTTERSALESALKEHGVVEGDTCLIITDNTSWYYHYMVRYLLWSSSGDSTSVAAQDPDTILAVWRDYKYLLVWEASDETRAWVAEAFGTPGPLIVTD